MIEKDKLTQHQFNIVNGSLLGDAWLNKVYGNSNSCFRKRQKRAEHILWVGKELHPYCSGKIFDVKTKQKRIRSLDGKISTKIVPEYIVGYQVSSISHPIFTELRQKWYPNEFKVVPRDLILNPELLSIWYVDDGSNSKKYRQCCISTDGFSFEDVEFLCHRFNVDLGINVKPNKHVNNYNISFHGDGYEKLLNLVTPFIIWKDFSYKLFFKKLKRRKNLSETEKKEIVELLWQGKSCVEISKKFAIDYKSIWHIKNSEFKC